MKPVSLCLLFLVSSCFAGCVDQQGGLGLKGMDQHPTFRATYTTNDPSAKIQLTFGSPSTIMDSDLVEVLAYPLTVERIPLQSNALTRTYWLSHDARVIRADSYCADQCGFDYGDMNWVMRGHWPPFGAFFLTTIEASTAMTIGGSSLGISPRVIQRGDGAEVTVNTSQSDGLYVAGYTDLVFWSRYVYDDWPVPREMTRPGATLRLESFTELGTPETSVPVLRTLPRPEAIPSAGQWFPGSDRPLVGNIVPVDEAMQAAMNASGEFASAAKRECVASIAMQSTFVAGQNLGLEPTNVYASKFQASLIQSPDVLLWRWQRNDDILRGSTWSTPSQELEATTAQCKMPTREISLDAQQHVERVAGLFAGTGKMPATLLVKFQSRHVANCECPDQSLRFQTGMGKSDGQGTGLLSLADQSAITGHFVALAGTPDELQSFPGEFGWRP